MDLTELEGPRFELAIERLVEGHSFTYDRVGFRLDADGALECAALSTWSIENVTEEAAEADLRRAEHVLAELAARVSFSDVISGRPVRMVLVYDYRNAAAVALCTKTESGLAWSAGEPRLRA